MKVTSTFVATQIHKHSHIVCVCCKDGELKDSCTIHRVPEKGISEKNRPGWTREVWIKQKDQREMEPRPIPRNNSQELLSPLFNL